MAILLQHSMMHVVHKIHQNIDRGLARQLIVVSIIYICWTVSYSFALSSGYEVMLIIEVCDQIIL